MINKYSEPSVRKKNGLFICSAGHHVMSIASPFPSVESATLPPGFDDSGAYEKSPQAPSYNERIRSMFSYILGAEAEPVKRHGIFKSVFDFMVGGVNFDLNGVSVHSFLNMGESPPVSVAGWYVGSPFYSSIEKVLRHAKDEEGIEAVEAVARKIHAFFEARRGLIESLETDYRKRLEKAKAESTGLSQGKCPGPIRPLGVLGIALNEPSNPRPPSSESMASNASAFADVGQWFAAGATQRSRAQSARASVAQGAPTVGKHGLRG